MSNLKDHWNKIYATKADNEVSWYQTNPESSLNLINKYCVSKNHKIIDIGGGNSNLATELCKQAYNNCSVLDISSEAITRCKTKLANCANSFKLITTNILNFSSTSKYHIWHDRAVFHFLTNQTDILKYITTASTNIVQNGYLILSTFSKTGPLKCSGLPICQYNAHEIEILFKQSFKIVEWFKETHQTPFKTKQDFIWIVLRRN